jgi:hypothetical protein
MGAATEFRSPHRRDANGRRAVAAPPTQQKTSRRRSLNSLPQARCWALSCSGHKYPITQMMTTAMIASLQLRLFARRSSSSCQSRRASVGPSLLACPSTRYSKAPPSRSFSSNHVSAAFSFANTLRCRGRRHASSYRHRSKLSPSCNPMGTDQKFRDRLAICKAAKFLFDAFPHASCADLARGIAKYRGGADFKVRIPTKSPGYNGMMSLGIPE